VIGLLLAAAIAAPDSHGPTYDVSAIAQIEARSGWMGVPGNNESYDAIITPLGNQFVSTSTYHLSIDDRKVSKDETAAIPVQRVRQLLDVIAGPIRRAPVPEEFGASRRWLNDNAERAFSEYIYPGWASTGGFYSRAQQTLYIRSFTDPQTVSTMLLQYYSQTPWLDDYVYLTIDVRFKNWQHLKIESRQPETLMLPWTVSWSGKSYRTFDPGLSAAIGGLLPPDAVRYNRLSADHLLQQLPNLFGDYLKPQWERVGGFDVRGLIAPLEKEYNVRIGGPGSSGGNVKPVFGAELAWPDLPSSITALVDLPVVNNAFTDTSGIPAAKRFAQQVYAVPWLRAFLETHPQVTVKVLLERGGSIYLTVDQRNDLLADLRASGRAADQQTEQGLTSAFKVLIDEQDKYRFSQWVVLPDSTMLLWDYFDPGKTDSILDVDAAAIAGKPCARSTTQSCSGLMRSRDGSQLN
jgi:hypothetical protein